MVNKEQIREELATAIRNAASHMSSSLLAVRLRIDPPKVAALRNGRLEIFSIERLMHLATQLDTTSRLRSAPIQGRIFGALALEKCESWTCPTPTRFRSFDSRHRSPVD